MPETSLGDAISQSRTRLLLLVAILTGAFLLVGFSIASPAVQHLDLNVSRLVQSPSTATLDRIMLFVTDLGSSRFTAWVTVVVAAILAFLGRRRMALFLLLTLINLPLSDFLKLTFGRARPGPAMVHVYAPIPSSSFPSGHAMASTALYGFLAVLAWSHLSNRVLRVATVLLLTFTILSVGISRIYLGAHWLSDVLGGISFSLLLVTILWTAYRIAARHVATSVDKSPSAS